MGVSVILVSPLKRLKYAVSLSPCRFQPLTRGFHEAAGEHIREVLERALMQCTVLTEGDIIRVDCSQSSPGPPIEKVPAGLTAATRDDEAVGSMSSMDLDSDAGTSTDRPEEAVSPTPPPLVFELLVGGPPPLQMVCPPTYCPTAP